MSSSSEGDAGSPRIHISMSKQLHGGTNGSAAMPKSVEMKSYSNANRIADKTIQAAIGTNPGLYKSVRKALKNQTLNFKINVECTSLKVSPTGNFLWGGFSDGTLRVWDLSGTFGVEDDDVNPSRQKTDVLVNSKLTQGFGAVACQIHARGVHTDLITTVDISDDARYVFVGVARGAMELQAVFVGDLERAVHTTKQRERSRDSQGTTKRNILDYLKVYYHSDAKLKGFGACAKMRVAREGSADDPSYLLLTGKGIKNIHIWKFTPPKHPSLNDDPSTGRSRMQSICDPPDDDDDHGIWDQLYDTSTNGNTILLLGFYRDPGNKLLAVSKSDAQKLRLWDLSFEEVPEHKANQSRPKRPPYKDVVNSQSALEIAGGIGVCGGGNMYNEMSIVSLDQPDDPFNHTELALPSVAGSAVHQQAHSSRGSSRRQRRGEMKAVVKVATSPRDSSHALLELDDGSLVGYSAGSSSGGSSKDSSSSIPRLAIATPESTGIPALPADFWRRCICLANIAGVVIAASSLYNPNTNKGQLVIRALGGMKKPRGSEVAEKKKLKLKQQRQRERDLVRQQQEALLVPKTPSPRHTNLESSPVAADAQALRDAVSAPEVVPMSILRANKHAKNGNVEKETTSNRTAQIESSSSFSPSLTRVSPNGSMVSPKHQKLTNVADDSPDSMQSLPKISKFLQPKRIDMQAQQLQETTKKRRIEERQEKEITRKEAVTLFKKEEKAAKKPRKETNVAESSVGVEAPQNPKKTSGKVAANTKLPVSVCQLNTTGSASFNSPERQRKTLKTVDAPFKPKRPTIMTIVQASTTSSDPIVKDLNSMKEFNPIAPAKPSKLSTYEARSEIRERKRDRQAVDCSFAAMASKKTAHTKTEISTALLLTALASPKPVSKPKQLDKSAGAIPSTPGAMNKPSVVATIPSNIGSVASKPSKPVADSISRPKTPGETDRFISYPPLAVTKSADNVKTEEKTKKPQNIPTAPKQLGEIAIAIPKKTVSIKVDAVVSVSPSDAVITSKSITFAKNMSKSKTAGDTASLKTEFPPSTTSKSSNGVPKTKGKIMKPQITSPVPLQPCENACTRRKSTTNTAKLKTTVAVTPSAVAAASKPKTIVKSTSKLKTTPTITEPKTAATTTPNVVAMQSKSKAIAKSASKPKTAPTVTKPKTAATVAPNVVAVSSKSKTAAKSTSKPKTPGDTGKVKTVSSLSATSKSSSNVSKSKGKPASPLKPPASPQQPSKEAILHEKINEQYKQLRTFLQDFSKRSMALVHLRNLKRPVPSAVAGTKGSGSAKKDRNHSGAYSKLLTEHKSVHNYLQRKLLRSAETTLRNLLESRISADEARSELKQTIKKFEAILCDTLHRQEMERLAVVAQHRELEVGSLDSERKHSREPSSQSTKERSNYPYLEAFEKVGDIYAAIARPVGRPRSAAAALR